MRRNKQDVVVATVALLLTPLLFVGCKSTIVRENIISTINSGFGVQLAENAGTQLYEVKVGYIRNQFYSIPTAKNVRDTNSPGFSTNNIGTPQLVSGIGGSVDTGRLSIGMGVAENFAVGDKAILSPAAVAMYLATARSQNADAIAKAMQTMYLATASSQNADAIAKAMQAMYCTNIVYNNHYYNSSNSVTNTKTNR